ncbi:MAG TPA: 4Fe-4S dicluster domain-containing protein [Candidatus Deferrimicrobium sp.]|nr:4Fe-4S dicluster domain-containing protein [Candidatus Deferrimicrobium sp.]
MAKVYNWQLAREMSYWYPESRPQRQFAAIFDVNKCIACQTCTLACKTTWTSGRGQEYMFWNNVESKPYGFYPLGWDVHLLEMLGAQNWSDGRYEGLTIFESALAGERVLGFRPQEADYSYPNIGEDDASGVVERGGYFLPPHAVWMFYLARICNHCTYPACLAACPRGSIYKRPEDGIVLIDQSRCLGYQECVRACPYKKTYFNPHTGTSEKCIGCYPKIEKGLQPQCFENCIGKIRLQGWLSVPDKADANNPVDYLVHIRKIALPLYPQFGLEPNVYYVPPLHVPDGFLVQLFGPRGPAAVKEYLKAREDAKLAGLLGLFGSAPNTMAYFSVDAADATAYDASHKKVVSVPIIEPTHIRPDFDPARDVARQNTP